METNRWYEVRFIENGYGTTYTCFVGSEEDARKNFDDYVGGKKSFSRNGLKTVDPTNPVASMGESVTYELVEKIVTYYAGHRYNERCLAQGKLGNQTWWKEWREKRQARTERSSVEVEAAEARKIATKARKAAENMKKSLEEREAKLIKITSAKDRKAYEETLRQPREAVKIALEKAQIAEEAANEKERLVK